MSAQTHRLVVKTEVKTKAFNTQNELPTVEYFNTLFENAVDVVQQEKAKEFKEVITHSASKKSYAISSKRVGNEDQEKT